MSWMSYRRGAAAAVSCAALLAFWSAAWLGPLTPPAPARASPAPLSWDSSHRLLPHAYWHHRAEHPERYSQLSCASLPRRERLEYAAAAWQRLRLAVGNLYIYGAYWDDRFQEPLVRVLVYCDVKPPPPLVCLLWYEDENAPDKVPAKALYGWRPIWGGPKDGVNEPYILSCSGRRHPPALQRPPAAVSIVLEDHLCGTPTNILNVQGVPPGVFSSPSERRTPAPRDDSVCVCLKWIQFHDDIAVTLVEWIEFIKEFGAARLFAFMIRAHPNTERVMSYYAAQGFAETSMFAHAPQLRGSFSARARDFHDYRRELLPLNDCLYRARASACRWLLPIDSDEIVVPHHNYSTWQEVIAAATSHKSDIDALACRNYYFLDGAQKKLSAPPHMKILGHRWRAREPNKLGHNVKSFHNTSSVVAMHNHYPMACKRSCRSVNVKESVARLHHYRWRCGDGRATCAALRDTVRDDTLARWAHVALRVRGVLRELQLDL